MFDQNLSLESKLATPSDREIGCGVEVEIKYPHALEQKTKSLPFGTKSENVEVSELRHYMKSPLPRLNYEYSEKNW